MNPEQFLKTVYLGDRACKAVLIDGWNRELALQIDCISRVRSSSGNWEYYSEEDVTDGWLTFTGVSEISIQPPGLIPNDYIQNISVQVIDDGTKGTCRIEIDIGCVGAHKEGIVTIALVAEGALIRCSECYGVSIIEQ